MSKVNEEFLDDLLVKYRIRSNMAYSEAEDGVYTIDEYQEAQKKINEEFTKAILQHFQQEQETTLKQGFYAGQANAGIKLEEAHKNWKEWSGYMLSNLKDKGGV